MVQTSLCSHVYLSLSKGVHAVVCTLELVLLRVACRHPPSDENDRIQLQPRTPGKADQQPRLKYASAVLEQGDKKLMCAVSQIWIVWRVCTVLSTIAALLYVPL